MVKPPRGVCEMDHFILTDLYSLFPAPRTGLSSYSFSANGQMVPFSSSRASKNSSS